MEAAPPDVGTDDEPALDVDELGVCQGRQLRPGTVAARALALELSLDGSPIDPSLSFG